MALRLAHRGRAIAAASLVVIAGCSGGGGDPITPPPPPPGPVPDHVVVQPTTLAIGVGEARFVTARLIAVGAGGSDQKAVRRIAMIEMRKER